MNIPQSSLEEGQHTNEKHICFAMAFQTISKMEQKFLKLYNEQVTKCMIDINCH